MNVSVLLPTRDGGAQLDTAIRSVLATARPDIELVIADNASGLETQRIIDKWRTDPRVIVVRQPSPTSVDLNWQAAYDASTRDHLLVIGDDDALLPLFFDRIDAIITSSQAQAVSFNAYGFISCGAMPDDPRAYWSKHLFAYAPELRHALLSADDLRRIAKDLFRFKLHLPLNLQATLFSRALASRVPAPLFRAPFPDHFALAGMLLNAGSWAVSDEPLLVVGLTPKSFGRYAYGGRESQGLSYLGVDTSFPGRVEGDPLINGMHRWLLVLKEVFPTELSGTQVDRTEYLLRQLWWSARQAARRGTGSQAIIRPLRSMSPTDWIRVLLAMKPSRATQLTQAIARVRRRARWAWRAAQPIENVCTLEEFINWLAGRSPAMPEPSLGAESTL